MGNTRCLDWMGLCVKQPMHQMRDEVSFGADKHVNQDEVIMHFTNNSGLAPIDILI